MENTSVERIESILKAQREFFAVGITRDVGFRKSQLKKLLEAMDRYEKRLTDALWTDLHKSFEEAYLTEISIVKGEIKTALRNVGRWSRREKVKTPVTMFPSASYIVKEPLGCTLIISPWNYPVQLLLSPLVGALAAGCTAVLKPSPYVPHVSEVIGEMISDTFDEGLVAVVQGNRDVNTALLERRFDLIFFTGSPALARTVMAAAAKNLTPLVLELGGKSPCVVSGDADIRLAAKRIAWGKMLNGGQTCIAPDYILIDENILDGFVAAFADAVKSLQGDDIKSSRHYVRMVNDRAFDRVSSYIDGAEILYGGRTDQSERFIEPTLLRVRDTDVPVMQEEIFGPVFPVIALPREGFADSVAGFVNGREKPLAFYWFGSEKDGWNVIGRTSSGGACINDTLMHIGNDRLPFGGVGNSGMGSYHNKRSFDAFTHTRAVVSTPTSMDLPFRYMPYRLFSLIKNIL